MDNREKIKYLRNPWKKNSFLEKSSDSDIPLGYLSESTIVNVRDVDVN